MFAYTLKPFTVSQEAADELSKIVPVENDIRLHNTVKRILGQYFYVASIGGDYYIIHKDEKNSVFLTPLSNMSMKQRFANLKFLAESHYYYHELDLPLPTKKGKTSSKKKNFTTRAGAPEKESVPIEPLHVRLNALVENGKIDKIAYQKVFCRVSYQPGSIYNQLEPDTISTWEPSPFFFFDPVKGDGHNHQFCKYANVIARYSVVIKMMALSPFDFDASAYPELKPLVCFFDVVKATCEDNEALAMWFLRWISGILHGGLKTECCPVFYSPEKGVGKSAVAKIVSRLIHNFHNMTAETFTGSAQRFFGESMSKQLIIVEEIKDVRNGMVLENLKNLATNHVVTAEQKNEKRVQYVNYLNFMLTTNEIPNLLVELGDRRMVFMRSSPRILIRDSGKPLAEKAFAYVLKNLYEGSTDSDFEDIKDIRPDPQGDVEVITPCQNCKKRKEEGIQDEGKKYYLMAILSVILMEIGVENPFKPGDRVPLTDTHMNLQLNKSPLIRLICGFVQRKCNNYFMKSPGTWMCAVPQCPIPMSAHFDDEGNNTDWQILHVSFENLKKEDDLKLDFNTKKKMRDQFNIELYEPKHFHETYYNFPPLVELEKEVRKLLNLDCRIKI